MIKNLKMLMILAVTVVSTYRRQSEMGTEQNQMLEEIRPAGRNKMEERMHEDNFIVFEPDARINIADSRFMPETININVGDIVEWINKDKVLHTVIGPDIDEDLSPGETYSHIFDQAGTYFFESDIYPEMIGKIIVRDLMPTGDIISSETEEEEDDL